MSKFLGIILVALIVVAMSVGFIIFVSTNQNNPPSLVPAAVTIRPEAPSSDRPRPPAPIPSSTPAGEEIVVSGLKIPWSIAWLPDGSLLVTERPGQLIKISPAKETIPIVGVTPVGEGGLLGLALHPAFAQNNFIYLYLTTGSRLNLINRVERYRLAGNRLEDRTVVLDNIPASQFHDGGYLAFGPEGKLYITTGDAGDEPSAQDLNSLAGKILRLKDDGSIPEDNPFGNAVYSLGHRNPQGLAWDQAGRLWATEHGRSGVRSGYDEINLIEAGKNYGWPEIQGDETRTGLEVPRIHSGAATTWAPAGAAILNNTLYFAGLRGEALYRAKLDGESINGAVEPLFQNAFGRLRAVQIGPDGWLYVTTSNTDGRGEPKAGDDKIIRLNPSGLK